MAVQVRCLFRAIPLPPADPYQVRNGHAPDGLKLGSVTEHIREIAPVAVYCSGQAGSP